MRVKIGVAASVALLTASIATASAQVPNSRVYSLEEQGDFAPPVDLWLDRISYNFGERIRPYFVTEPGAYVTIVRVTTDGELRVLYPLRPSAQVRYMPGQLTNDRVPDGFKSAFNLYESSGTGFVFAIASWERFDYSYFASGSLWNTVRLASYGRHGDPFEIMRRFVDRTLSDRTEFSMDYVAYEVYSQRNPSRYATRYHYSSFDDYYDRCYSAFGLHYTHYCRAYDGYYGRYFGPIVVGSPRFPRGTSPRSPREPRIKPLVPDPMVPTRPIEQAPAEGRLGTSDRAEAAAIARRERLLRSASPRINPRSDPTIVPERIERQRPQEPREREPVIYRSAPREPRSEPRVEPRPLPRIERPSEPRVHVQAPPRTESRPQPRSESAPQSRPREKDKQ